MLLLYVQLNGLDTIIILLGNPYTKSELFGFLSSKRNSFYTRFKNSIHYQLSMIKLIIHYPLSIKPSTVLNRGKYPLSINEI